MFTGLIADIGRIAHLRHSTEGRVFRIETGFDSSDFLLGESIAVDGACLTVTAVDDQSFTVDASPETLQRTTLGERQPGDRVHLERALRIGDRLGGHLVSGHVDGVGIVRTRTREGNAWLLTLEAPPEVALYLIEKGSICVDGVSLTVNWCNELSFGLAIIPHTAQYTTLTDYHPGRRVNLEADVLGKYVHKFIASNDTPSLNLDSLRRAGFHTD